jgi:Tol biopolymer transport system component
VKRIGPGGPLRLTSDPRPEFRPAWSPDGSSIAFVREESPSSWAVFLVPPPGGTPRKVDDVPGGYLDYEAPRRLVPRRKKVGVGWKSRRESTRGPLCALSGKRRLRVGELFLLDLSATGEPTGQPRQLTGEGGLAIAPAWMPGGQEIVYCAWIGRRSHRLPPLGVLSISTGAGLALFASGLCRTYSVRAPSAAPWFTIR